MNVLISNDDGVEARGLLELARALHEEVGLDVYVCVPDGQRSASGHGITLGKSIYVSEVKIDHAEKAYQTSGLPADCVKLGLELLRKEGIEIDMVFAGINHGGNLGTDTLYSGTVACAMEGSICGYPSAAVSVDHHQAKHFDYACELAVKTAKAYMKQIEEGTADCRTVLNINVPDRPKEELKGLKYTRLGDRKYIEIFINEEGSENLIVPGNFQYTGTPVHYTDLPEDVDVIANQNGYATVTPIQSNLTDHEMVDRIREWDLG